jgi:site-specific DNA-methyltransferase (adenine-specific)
LRVLKPGGHLLAFAGTRTQHRMAMRIEDAGFEIRDMIAWVYGSGFPKSLDVSKAIDKATGAEREVVGSKFGQPGYRSGPTGENDVYGAGLANGDAKCEVTAPATDAARQWAGWGTALKPALEPITVVRKPLIGTVAENVLEHGTGALNVDGCRVGGEPWKAHSATGLGSVKFFTKGETPVIEKALHDAGRWPANLIHDGSDDVVGLLRDSSRFFYCAKASKRDRGDNNHPTVKPTDLMRYLCRLVTPPEGTVLDPFMGSGSTGKAAVIEGFNFIGIERQEEYFQIAEKRILELGLSL